ncbi:MAG: nucleotidyltransferase domain-containing protein [Candidatus Nanohaloarchaeota archaeon QJJ-9]|nr:nucleotidyltransferase domain-containing protein [Candidatus Nanohaloarchaeota archaeon QJJ-9]
MADTHKEAFEEFASEAHDKFETIKEIILFGSVAKNMHGANSDVDILIKVSDLSEREEIEELAYQKTSEFGVSITPVVVKVGDTKTKVVENAEKEGIKYVRS